MCSGSQIRCQCICSFLMHCMEQPWPFHGYLAFRGVDWELSITFEWSTATERIMEAKRTCTEIQRRSWFCLWSILSVFKCPFVHIFDLADWCINVGVNLPGTATGRQSSKKRIWQGTENVILSQDKTIQNTDENAAIKWIEKKSVLCCCTL